MITAERANAYARHYTNSSDLAEPHDPIRATVYMICAQMCVVARFTATHSEQAALKLVKEINGGNTK